jgi:hypothetical protein
MDLNALRETFARFERDVDDLHLQYRRRRDERRWALRIRLDAEGRRELASIWDDGEDAPPTQSLLDPAYRARHRAALIRRLRALFADDPGGLAILDQQRAGWFDFYRSYRALVLAALETLPDFDEPELQEVKLALEEVLRATQIALEIEPDDEFALAESLAELDKPLELLRTRGWLT